MFVELKNQKNKVLTYGLIQGHYFTGLHRLLESDTPKKLIFGA